MDGNQTGCFHATHRHIRTGDLYRRLELPHKPLDGEWGDIGTIHNVIVYLGSDGRIWSTTQERWESAFEVMPAVDPAEVLRRIHELLGPEGIQFPEPEPADRFDHWLKHLLKIRDTTDYEEQRALIEGLANYIADLEGEAPGWWMDKYGAVVTEPQRSEGREPKPPTL